MTSPEPQPAGAPAKAPAPWVRLAALAVLTGGVLVLCGLLLAPFVPGLTWGVALAALALPMHRAVGFWVRNRTAAAAVSTTLVVLLLLVPTVLVMVQLTNEVRAAGEKVQEQAGGGRWRETVGRIPYAGEWLLRAEPHVDFEAEARKLLGQIGNLTLGLVNGTAWASLQALIAVFVMYFCFRDRHRLLDGVRALIPLDRADTDRVLQRVDDSVYATVYGTVLTGLIQGATGGLMFWLLGLPAPVLWGAVMFVLSVLPVLGAFMVWAPAAVYLVNEGQVGKAVALVAWGLLMAGPVCNYIYAVVAGGRMRMHPVPALLAFVGGLAAFGLSGMVLGPAVVATAAALLDVWRERVMRRVPRPEPETGGDPTTVAESAGLVAAPHLSV